MTVYVCFVCLPLLHTEHSAVQESRHRLCLCRIFGSNGIGQKPNHSSKPQRGSCSCKVCCKPSWMCIWFRILVSSWEITIPPRPDRRCGFLSSEFGLGFAWILHRPARPQWWAKLQKIETCIAKSTEGLSQSKRAQCEFCWTWASGSISNWPVRTEVWKPNSLGTCVSWYGFFVPEVCEGTLVRACLHCTHKGTECYGSDWVA